MEISSFYLVCLHSSVPLPNLLLHKCITPSASFMLSIIAAMIMQKEKARHRSGFSLSQFQFLSLAIASIILLQWPSSISPSLSRSRAQASKVCFFSLSPGGSSLFVFTQIPPLPDYCHRSGGYSLPCLYHFPLSRQYLRQHRFLLCCLSNLDNSSSVWYNHT